MSRGLGELLAAPPRAGMLPDGDPGAGGGARRLAAGSGGCGRPRRRLAALRGRIGRCLGIDRIPRVPGAWQPVREIAGDGYAVEVGTYEAVPGPGRAGARLPARRRPGRTRRSCTRRATGWRTRGSTPDLQRFNALLARAGMVVLCYDPLGQGERRSGWHQHGQLAPLLVGIHVARRDGGRGDGRRSTCWRRATTSTPRRLALTGASGGGFVSAFAAAVDDRASPRRASAASSTRTSRSCATPPTAPAGTAGSTSATRCRASPRRPTWATWSAAAAPRDVTVVHAVDDPPFPIAGARAVVAEAARSYAAAGAGGRVRLVELAGGHGLHPAMRVAAAAALARALGLPPPAPEAPRAAARARLAGDARRRAHGDGRRPRRARPSGCPARRCAGRRRHQPGAGGARARGGRVACAPAASPTAPRSAAALGGASERRAGGERVTNHVALPDGGYAQRLELDVATGDHARRRAAAARRLGRRRAGRAGDGRRGRQGGGAGRPGGGGRAASAAGRCWRPTCAAPARAPPSEFELATAAWLLDRDLLADRVARPAVVRAAAVGALLDGPADRQAAHRRARRRRRSRWSRCWPRRSTTTSPARSARAFVASLEELLVESPRITPMVFPFRALETYDVPDLVRLAAPRPLAPAARSDDAALVAAGCSRRWGRDGRHRRHEVADRVFACEQPDGPRIIRQVVIGGDARGAGGRHGPAGLARRRASCRCWSGSACRRSCCSRTPTATTWRHRRDARRATPIAALMAGAADVDLMGDPERAIRERYARFAATTTCRSATADARARAGPVRRGRSARPSAVHRRRDARPRRPPRRRCSRRPATARATPPPGWPPTACWPRPTPRWARRSPTATGNPYIPPMYAPPATYRATIAQLEGAAGRVPADRPRAGDGRGAARRRCWRSRPRRLRPPRGAHGRGADGRARHAAGSSAAACTRRTAACRPTACATWR